MSVCLCVRSYVCVFVCVRVRVRVCLSRVVSFSVSFVVSSPSSSFLVRFLLQASCDHRASTPGDARAQPCQLRRRSCRRRRRRRRYRRCRISPLKSSTGSRGSGGDAVRASWRRPWASRLALFAAAMNPFSSCPMRRVARQVELFAYSPDASLTAAGVPDPPRHVILFSRLRCS